MKDDFVPSDRLKGYVDDVKRLAYKAEGPNAKLIQQYALEVEDLVRQVIADRAEGYAANYTAQKAIEKAKMASRLASENSYWITNIATAKNKPTFWHW